MFLNPGISIEVRNVSKKFAINNTYTRKAFAKSLRSALTGNWNNGKLNKGEFYALNDISLEIKKGETLGIIGLNGSGKSTLLKMFQGLLLPDIGEIIIDGEVGGLIELSAGMNPQMTGRENIYLKCALLGRSKEVTESIFDDIVSFSELDEFIDTPLRNYSSGMQMRLGFSIAIHTKPDIMLMDEVLAVGDFIFRQKCLAKVNEMRDDMTVILVSHSMNDIRMFCDRVMLLDKGKQVFIGEVDEGVKRYLTEIKKDEKKSTVKPKELPFYGELFTNNDKIEYLHAGWFDSENNRVTSAESGKFLKAVIEVKLKYTPKELIAGIPVWTEKGAYISGIQTEVENVKIFPQRG
jgi:ABC-type polysaccharide/polyol phosphate transport system ATPase subunit